MRFNLKLKEEVAKTGGAGILLGVQAGPEITLRAYVDGLLITKRVDLSCTSKATSTSKNRVASIMYA